MTAFVSIVSSESGYGDTKLIARAYNCSREQVNENSSLYTKALTAYAYALENRTIEASEIMIWMENEKVRVVKEECG